MSVPVVFLVFNRPEKTARVFDAIRRVAPARLHVVCDGPRAGVTGEIDRVLETRRIATSVDWPCDLTTDFSETNLGCRHRVSSGLSGAFERFDRAIILEDDCLPDPSFFPFCEEMLDRYASAEHVMHIGGTNFLSGWAQTPVESYYFSRLFHIWGWATWRRAWRHYDVTMQAWPAFKQTRGLRAALPDRDMRGFWSRTFDLSHRRAIDSWDHQWSFACLRAEGLAVIPSVNLVANIGFDGQGTHTESHHHNPAPHSAPLPFPLRHPAAITWNREADRYVQRRNFPRRFGMLQDWIDILRGV
ncbi:glycosyltransferase family 2 protein [Kamptonema cortianum]|nr:glycosyltransferase family 2 protein [Oscillatoria laete-virens]MDK3155403.1 glycosyltransferase family 2 protein [Kamptonema cortianum]MDL5046150.1 glycosyltransferase family 2 protein [Oscillatoria amoena NRMC-F 0135]MDL5052848.1 glycosyltransferase family 2 protein [Oscillatoria laete-virens NRMC-F 0139]